MGEDDINVRAIGEEFDARLHMRVVDHNQVAVDPDKSSESLKGRSSGGDGESPGMEKTSESSRYFHCILGLKGLMTAAQIPSP